MRLSSKKQADSILLRLTGLLESKYKDYKNFRYLDPRFR
jgi:hypothetical protein